MRFITRDVPPSAGVATKDGMLAPALQNPSEMLNKLLREQHLAFHANHLTYIADHFHDFV